MAHCIYIPTITDQNGNQIESKLFRDLQNYTSDREVTKALWALTQVPSVVKTLEGIEYDSNGEVTLESLDKAISIKNYVEGKTSLLSEKRSLKAVDSNNKPILYEKSENITQKVIDYNKQNKDLVANINRVGDKYAIDVQYKNNQNSKLPGQVEFSNALNNQLLGKMQALGFDVSTVNSSEFHGIFTPQTGQETADGLREVIRVAKGEQGEAAFSEEFSHFMIEGLRHTPLVQRLLSNLDSEAAIREVLGDQYDSYYERYQGNMNRMTKEAAGKMLDAQIKNPKEVPQSRKNLISRVWNNIKNFFRNFTNQDIDSAITKAQEAVTQLAESIMDDSVMPLFNKDNLLDAQDLYKLNTELDSLEKLAEEGVRLYAKKLSSETRLTRHRVVDPTKLNVLNNLRNLVENKKYASSTINFMNEGIKELIKIQDSLKNMTDVSPYDRPDRLVLLNQQAKILNNIREHQEAYSPIIQQLLGVEALLEAGDVNLTQEDARLIQQAAAEVSAILAKLQTQYKSMQFDTIFNYLSEFWQGDFTMEVGANKGKILSLEMMMRMSEKDIGGWDRVISSLADASDPLLSLIDRVFKENEASKDKLLQKAIFEIKARHKILTDAGFSDTFMDERGEDGKPTGRIISDIDYIKFNKVRLAVKTRFEEQGLTPQDIHARMSEWDRLNMEDYTPDHTDELRKERRPKQFDLNGKPLFYKDVLSKLAPAQRAYYDAMLEAKDAFDMMLPKGYTHLHNSIHVRSEFTEAMLQHGTDPKTLKKVLVAQVKDRFMDAEHDTEYGQYLGEDGKLYEPVDRKTHKKITTDFSGKEVKSVPVYFTSKLRDSDRLSVDFTGKLVAYAAMAINYKEMSNAVDIMELFRDHFYRREIKKKSGTRQLIDSIKVGKEISEKEQTIKGAETNAVQRLDNYLDANMYGMHKHYEGTIKMGQTELNKAKLLDELRNYTTHVGLGLNIFSGIGNIAMGKLQMFLESFGGEHYNIKDTIASEALYWKMLPSAIAEANSITKSNLLDLLNEEFNALDDYSGRASRDKFYKSPVARMAGKFSVMSHMEGGEHYIRTKNMLNHLNAYKVKDAQGNTIPLHKAYDVIDQFIDGTKVGAKLQLKEGITKVDGTPLTQKDLTQLRLHVMRASKYITVNTNPMDRSAIQRYAMGRLLMQFRGWIPAHFNRRFAKGFYDANLQQEIEGFYRTAGNFGLEMIKSFRKFDFNVKTNWKNLNNHERANLRKAGMEFTIFAALSGLVSLFGSVKDKESAWIEKMILYQAHRLRLQTGVSMPLNINFYENIIQMMQSPVAAMSMGDNLLKGLAFWNIFQTIENGRFKGDNKYLRDIVNSLPYLPAVQKAIDLHNDSYMFNIWR